MLLFLGIIVALFVVFDSYWFLPPQVVISKAPHGKAQAVVFAACDFVGDCIEKSYARDSPSASYRLLRAEVHISSLIDAEDRAYPNIRVVWSRDGTLVAAREGIFHDSISLLLYNAYTGVIDFQNSPTLAKQLVQSEEFSEHLPSQLVEKALKARGGAVEIETEPRELSGFRWRDRELKQLYEQQNY